jgi:glycerophosphoryl diester phosphodiesterase
MAEEVTGRRIGSVGEVLIFAHRGFSGRQPEMTRAAYAEAIAWAEETRVPLELECDVHFSADDHLICLHDLTVNRTSDGDGPAYALTLAELQALDFGSWAVSHPTPDQCRLITLEELLIVVHEARERDVDVGLAIETKHPNPRGLDVEERVAAQLEPYGWHRSGSPVRLITFSVPALDRLRILLPDLERTLLIEEEFGPWLDGHLPAGVRLSGVDLALLRLDPDYVARARAHGHGVHVWTANTPADIAFCSDLGVAGITTDYPDRVAAELKLPSSL